MHEDAINLAMLRPSMRRARWDLAAHVDWLRLLVPHHLGVDIVNIPAVAACLSPCYFSFRNGQLQFRTTHAAEGIARFLGFRRELGRGCLALMLCTSSHFGASVSD